MAMKQVVQTFNPQTGTWVYHSDYDEYDDAILVVNRLMKTTAIARVELMKEKDLFSILRHVARLQEERDLNLSH